jgi:uncharacterized protein
MSVFINKISVKVQPNAGRNEVVGLKGSIWKIKVAAPPEKGKANKELIEFLSDTLGVRKTSIMILKGETSHNKILGIEGIDQNEVEAALAAAIKSGT